MVACPVTVLKYWNQSARLLGGTCPLEQKPVQARIISKLILTNAGSILRSIIRVELDTVQSGEVYSQHGNGGVVMPRLSIDSDYLVLYASDVATRVTNA